MWFKDFRGRGFVPGPRTALHPSSRCPALTADRPPLHRPPSSCQVSGSALLPSDLGIQAQFCRQGSAFRSALISLIVREALSSLRIINSVRTEEGRFLPFLRFASKLSWSWWAADLLRGPTMPLHLSHESLPALKDSIPTMGVGVDLNWPVKGKPVSCSWKQYLRFKLKLLVRSGFPPSKSFRLPASFPGGTWGCEEERVVPLLILEFAILCGVPPGHWVPCTGVHWGVLALPGVGVQVGPRCWSLWLLPRPLALGVPPSCHSWAQPSCRPSVCPAPLPPPQGRMGTSLHPTGSVQAPDSGITERILLAAPLPANHVRASEGLSGSPGHPGEAGLGPLSLRVLQSYWVLFFQPPHRTFGLEGAIGTSLSLLFFWLGLSPSPSPSPLPCCSSPFRAVKAEGSQGNEKDHQDRGHTTGIFQNVFLFLTLLFYFYPLLFCWTKGGVRVSFNLCLRSNWGNPSVFLTIIDWISLTHFPNQPFSPIPEPQLRSITFSDNRPKESCRIYPSWRLSVLIWAGHIYDYM